MSVSQGKLSPNFASGTTSYKVTLPSTASSIKISASARDAKASVSGAGTRELEPGIISYLLYAVPKMAHLQLIRSMCMLMKNR